MQVKCPKDSRHKKTKGWVFSGEGIVIKYFILQQKLLPNNRKNGKINLQTDFCNMNKHSLSSLANY